MATETQDATDVFRWVVDALNDRNFDRFAELHTEDVVLHDHGEEFHGVDAAVEHEQALYEAFPDMEYTIEDILTENDRIAGRWRVTGTHEREFEGIPPTDEAIDIPASGIFRVEDGKIAEVWLTYDRLGMLQQLGVVNPPGE
jgi:steroid delta-isomerase-like uncharacterized protein